MSTESLITPEALAAIGNESAPLSEEVSKSMIRRFANASFVNNPLHTDEELAKTGPYGGLVAPPAFFMTLAKPFNEEERPLVPVLKTKRMAAAGDEWEFLVPIRPGDTITRRSKLVDMYEKSGRSGPMVFFVIETLFTNQHGELAVRTRSTGMAY